MVPTNEVHNQQNRMHGTTCLRRQRQRHAYIVSLLVGRTYSTPSRRTHLQERIALEEGLESSHRLEVNKPRLKLGNQRLLSTTGQDVPLTSGERNGPERARCAAGKRQERDAVQLLPCLLAGRQLFLPFLFKLQDEHKKGSGCKRGGVIAEGLRGTRRDWSRFSSGLLCRVFRCDRLSVGVLG